MTDDLSSVVREHCKGLAGRNLWVYKWYLALDAAGLENQESTSASQSYALLAELVVSNEIREPSFDFPEAISRVRPVEALVEVLDCWQQSLQAAYPKRAAMESILQHFLGWFALVRRESRQEFLEALPKMCPTLGKMKTSDVTGMIQGLSSLEANDRRAVLKTLSEHGETEPDVLLALSSLGISAAQMKHLSVMEQLRDLIGPDEFQSSRDARRFFPALDRLSTACCQRGPTLWAAAMDLVVTLANNGHVSSGYVTARDLPSRIGGLDDELACSYLDAFGVLAKHIGVSIVGFGLGQLPKMCQSKGPERTATIARAAARISDHCGKTAAHAFLEGKTEVARKVLGAFP